MVLRARFSVRWQIQGNCSRQLSLKSCNIITPHKRTHDKRLHHDALGIELYDHSQIVPFLILVDLFSQSRWQLAFAVSQATSELLGKSMRSLRLRDARGSHLYELYVSIVYNAMNWSSKSDSENWWMTDGSAWFNWSTWLFHGATMVQLCATAT